MHGPLSSCLQCSAAANGLLIITALIMLMAIFCLFLATSSCKAPHGGSVTAGAGANDEYTAQHTVIGVAEHRYCVLALPEG